MFLSESPQFQLENLAVLLLPLILSLPTFFIVLFVVRRRRPDFGIRRFVFLCLAGLLTVPLALLAQVLIPFTGASWWGFLLRSFILVALVEELAKVLGVLIVRKPAQLGVLDAAVAGMAVSLSFALFESFALAASDPSIVVFRMLSTLPLHAACGARSAHLAFMKKGFRIVPVLSFVLSVVLHGTFNLALSLPGFPTLIPALLAIVAFIAVLASLPGTEPSVEPDAK